MPRNPDLNCEQVLWYRQEARELKLLLLEYLELQGEYADEGRDAELGLCRDISRQFAAIIEIYEGDLLNLWEVDLRFGAIRSLQDQLRMHWEAG